MVDRTDRFMKHRISETQTPQDRRTRIDGDLDIIEEQVDDLPWSIENHMPVDGGAFELEWNYQIARGGLLDRVEQHYRDGEMSAQQKRRYQKLRVKIAGSLELIQQAGLLAPEIPLKD